MVLFRSGVTMAAMLSRAQRFLVQLPIRYKKIGGRRWFEGKTENISRSGVLFRADRVLKPKTAIQMSFTLPVSVKGDGPGEVLCRGSVVRAVAGAGENRPCVAVSIERYRFVRTQEKTPCQTEG
jgi:PilZ domain